VLTAAEFPELQHWMIKTGISTLRLLVQRFWHKDHLRLMCKLLKQVSEHDLGKHVIGQALENWSRRDLMLSMSEVEQDAVVAEFGKRIETCLHNPQTTRLLKKKAGTTLLSIEEHHALQQMKWMPALTESLALATSSSRSAVEGASTTEAAAGFTAGATDGSAPDTADVPSSVDSPALLLHAFERFPSERGRSQWQQVDLPPHLFSLSTTPTRVSFRHPTAASRMAAGAVAEVKARAGTARATLSGSSVSTAPKAGIAEGVGEVMSHVAFSSWGKQKPSPPPKQRHSKRRLEEEAEQEHKRAVTEGGMAAPMEDVTSHTHTAPNSTSAMEAACILVEVPALMTTRSRDSFQALGRRAKIHASPGSGDAKRRKTEKACQQTKEEEKDDSKEQDAAEKKKKKKKKKQKATQEEHSKVRKPAEEEYLQESGGEPHEPDEPEDSSPGKWHAVHARTDARIYSFQRGGQ
jgi:hypothetical protein